MPYEGDKDKSTNALSDEEDHVSFYLNTVGLITSLATYEKFETSYILSNHAQLECDVLKVPISNHEETKLQAKVRKDLILDRSHFIFDL